MHPRRCCILGTSTEIPGGSTAFEKRASMACLSQEVKKQAKKRKEFSQFVLAFVSFSSPVAWNGSGRC
jgi:hypothetical protein